MVRSNDNSLAFAYTEPGRGPLQHGSRDGLPGRSASNPDTVDQLQDTEELAARPFSRSGSEAHDKPLFSTKVRTRRH